MDPFTHRERKRRDRIIERLRRHAEYGGDWRYDREANEYVRADGARAYARAHLRMCCYNGCDHYSTRWYFEPREGVAAVHAWL